MNTGRGSDQTLDAWIATHFDDEVAFPRELVRLPTDTPPGYPARGRADRGAALMS